MRLRKIRLAGFKSFVDPITIELPGDLIGVVGPNGCGKSNVIDAVRWVMGESSARHLRGALLADVIFNGAASRRPLGQASVELLFDNSERRGGTRLADRDELSVRRAVSRDGQSSYSLNGARCRRRDVTDLFLGTGLGPRSYAIIEQGTVSRLIEARPEELRGFLEEAAGISLYRERRRETESRMHRTQENLSRLGDLREELEQQLARLKRQAAQAERYTGLKAEERRLHSELLALRWRGFEREAGEGSAAIGAQEVKLEAARSRQRAAETALERARAAHEEATGRYNEGYRTALEARTEVGRAEEAIGELRRRRDELRARLERDERALAEAEAEAEADAARLGELEERLGLEQPRLERARTEAAERAGALEAAEGGLAAFRAEWDGFRERWEEHGREAHALEAALSHGGERLGEAAQRLQRLTAERAALAEPEEDAARGRELEAAERRLDAAREGLDERRRALPALRQAAADEADALHGRRERLEERSGRLASLEALQQAALARESREALDWFEEAGLATAPRLAQVLEVDPEWAHALECVLGSRLEAVRVDGIAPLAPALAGLDRAMVSLVEEGAAPEGGGGGDGLVDRVRSGRALAAPWLAGVGTARTVEEALARRAGLAPHESIVTPDGTWVGPNWMRVFRRRDERAGVLARERELAELRAAVAEDEAGARAGEEALAAARAALAAAEREREALEAEWAAANEHCTKLRTEHAARAAESQARRRRREAVERELGELGEGHASLRAAREEDERRLAGARERGEALARERAELERRSGALEAEAGALREAMERARHEAHEAALGVESARVQAAALEEARLRSETRMEELRAGNAQARERLAGSEAPIEEARARLHGRLESHREVDAGLERAREAVEAREREVREGERERRAREAEVADERSAHEELRLAWNAVLARRDAVAEQLAEGGFEPERVVSTLPDDAAPEAWQENLAAVERRIERLGPINLAAVTEFESGSERKRYLDEQHADLSEALTTLEDAIRKIDRETRTRFKDTFERVNGGLSERFPRLFGGGRASLELTGDDLLDTGVTVMAQPPGKRNASIQLLSGGEKALTAIALVFAIFDLNPAPFCLLDEVDTPLDDTNVGRFVELVREMSERLQVVLVTHNKVTMEAMGQLVGVTMQEPGVSRLVSVDVEQALEMVEA